MGVSKIKNKHEEFVKKIEEKFPKTFEILTEFENRETKMTIKHLKCGQNFESTARFLLETGRAKCCETRKLTKQKVQLLIEEKWPKKFEVLTENPMEKKELLIKHLECGETFNVLLKVILRNGMAKCCEGQIRTEEHFKKKLEEKQKNVYELLSRFEGMKKNITVKHLKCKTIFVRKAEDILKGVLPCCNENLKTKKEESEELLNKKWEKKFEILESKKIKCTDCGEIFDISVKQINRYGCKKCNKEKKEEKAKEIFLKKLEKKYPGEFTYIQKEETEKKDFVLVKHNKCGEKFSINKFSLLSNCSTPCCWKKNKSKAEKEILAFIKKNYKGKIEQSNRDTIKPFEIDIFIPELKIGIEYNGLYWHSEKFKEKSYHSNKTKLCKEKNIRLMHIFEDEWLEKKEIIKSKILLALNKQKKEINTKDCFIKTVTREERNAFLKINSLNQNIRSSINEGIFYKNNLIALICISKTTNKEEYEIKSFTTKNLISIKDGLNFLLKNTMNKYKEIKKITISLDNRLETEEEFIKNNFILKEIKEPDFFYVHKEKRFKTKQEGKNYKIFDCGKSVYYYKK